MSAEKLCAISLILMLQESILAALSLIIYKKNKSYSKEKVLKKEDEISYEWGSIPDGE